MRSPRRTTRLKSFDHSKRLSPISSFPHRISYSQRNCLIRSHMTLRMSLPRSQTLQLSSKRRLTVEQVYQYGRSTNVFVQCYYIWKSRPMKPSTCAITSGKAVPKKASSSAAAGKVDKPVLDQRVMTGLSHQLSVWVESLMLQRSRLFPSL
ncbi:hypothetical protein PGT21_026387 [Puccinia graminis f. sp. tritici]|uniref:Uncharacterized protein n=1 Tax=Puccinia graminis f. sp. tritici TaxID=56615 RepID=A0A5B0N1R4_PUCGR|nr:hypothetical protein PGT21_026387 [Puccinia graminis f. sp. tritici]